MLPCEGCVGCLVPTCTEQGLSRPKVGKVMLLHSGYCHLIFHLKCVHNSNRNGKTFAWIN